MKQSIYPHRPYYLARFNAATQPGPYSEINNIAINPMYVSSIHEEDEQTIITMKTGTQYYLNLPLEKAEEVLSNVASVNYTIIQQN